MKNFECQSCQFYHEEEVVVAVTCKSCGGVYCGNRCAEDDDFDTIKEECSRCLSDWHALNLKLLKFALGKMQTTREELLQEMQALRYFSKNL